MSGILADILSVSLPMTALILLLRLFLHRSGSRFTAGCRCLLWMIVLLRLCLPFPLLPIPALVQITAAPELPETAEPVPPATVHRPNQENLIIHFPADAAEPDVVEELLEDTLSAIYREDIPLPQRLPAGVKVEGLEEETPSEEPPSPVQKFTEIPAEPPTDIPETQEPVITPELPAEELPDTSLPPMTIAGIVWLTGAVGFTGWHLLAYLVCAAPITRTLAEPDASSRRIFASLCRKYGIRRPPRFRISPAVRSPMLYGYVRPTVVLPAVSLTANQTVAILAHELTHFRRRDLWGKLACVTGCALHWFNPAVHLAAARCQAEMELSCDESVLAGLDEEARRSYGNVMLDLLRFSACSRQTMPLTTQFPPKKRALRERFVNIMDMSKKKRGIAVILAAALLSSLSGLVFAYDTAPLSSEEEETAIRLNDRVRIRLGFGPLGKYEAVEEPELEITDFREAFARAEQIYAYFTGYASPPSGRERLTNQGHVYQSVALDTLGYPNTLDGLRTMTAEFFSETITDRLMNTVTGAGVPLYIEDNGTLYRFAGYRDLWSYDLGTREFPIMSALTGKETSKITVPVKITCSDDLNDPITIEYHYTAELRDGGFRFTDFRLPVELWREQAVYSIEESYLRGDLTITVPEGMAHYVVIPDQKNPDILIEFYHTAHYEQDPENGYGWLFSIGRHSYADLVRDDVNYGGIQYFAAAPDNSYFYYILRPTDVQWDITSETLSSEYQRLADMKDTLAQRILEDNGLIAFTGQDIPNIVLLSKINAFYSPDFRNRLEYDSTHGWLLRGENAGENGFVLGDFTKNAEVWAEWISSDCCRIGISQYGTLDLRRTDSGWSLESSAVEMTKENHLPRWVSTADKFLSDRAVQGQLCLYTTMFLQPYRSGESYVPDGAVIPESVVWDDLTVTPAASDEYDYLITYPVGAFTLTIRAKVTQNADGTISAEMSGGDYRLSEPIYAESGSLRDLLETLMREKRTDYTAELRVPAAGNAVLNLLVEGEGRDLHDLKDIFCTSFTANGRTYTFDTPLDLWGAWETEIYEAEGAVVLAQRPTTYSGNTYVLTPNASYEYHPGVFSLVLYEDDGDLRYHHSSALLHAAASRSGDGSSGLLATATSRDNFFSEWGDVTVTDGRLVFYEPDNSVTVGEAYDLDEEFRNYCRQAPVPYATLDALLQSNLLRDGDLHDYPTPDETALPATVSPTSVYRKVEGTGIHTSEYRLDLSTENPEGIELTSSVRIPQLNAAGKAVSEWNRSLFARISEECGALLADYAVPGTAERSLTISYEEIVSDGVVSLPITFTIQIRNPETAKWTTESRAEVHHYDTASGKFLTSEEYLLRITDGQFDYKTLAAALNEQKYSFWLSARMTENMPALTAENITGILPSELDENGFDIYLTFEKMYTPYHEKPLAVHWRESPVFTNEEGMTAAYHLLRAEGGYEVISHVYDPRELPLPEENQTIHYAPNKVYSGGLLDVAFSDDPYGDGIYETITFLNDKGDVTVKESVLGSSRRSASYYFEKYLAGTYDMKTLMENSGSVQAKGSSLLIGILNTYRGSGKPLESAPDFPAGIDIPQRVFVENVLAAYTETGDPAHPFKFAYPLEGGWVMDVYWNIHADAEMVPETIEFRQ